MKITLIAPITFDLGLYTIAPQLKAKGHIVNLLFIPDLMQDPTRRNKFSNKVMDNIYEFLRDTNLVGINGLSENYNKTASFVDSIKKKVKAPVIWGGIFATLQPHKCLEHADIVCVGEGEEAMIELAQKMEEGKSIDNIKNLLFHFQKSRSRPEVRPPIDLNTLLPFDYDLNSQFLVEGNYIRNTEEADLKGSFLTYSSRGCPFHCSYCCNSVLLRSVYGGYRFCRQRSIDNVIDELRIIKNRFSSCKKIWFNEADFLYSKTQEELEYFSDRYRSEINVPFYIWTNPASIDETKVKMLVEAGFRGTNIGTINANEEIQRRIYNRNATSDMYLKASRILKKYNVNVEYDFILCNPYESEEHIINNIKLLCALPKPFRTTIYSLTYFEETELYKKAVEDGVIKRNEQAPSYTKAAYKAWKFSEKAAYLNVVASLIRGMAREKTFFGYDCYGLLPYPVLTFLTRKSIVKFFDSLPFRSLIFNIVGNTIMIVYSILVKIANFYKRLKYISIG